MSLVSRWPLLSNSSDVVSTNHGSNTNITFSDAAVFTASNSNINCGSGANLNFGTGNFTICAWVKNVGSSLERKTIFRKMTGTAVGYFLDMRPSGVLVGYFGTSAGDRLFQDSIATINDGQSHFVAFVRTTGTTGKIYIDGLPSNGTTTINGTPNNINSAGDFTIGAESDSGTGPSFSVNWEGTVREARAYNHALSDFDILQLFNETNRNRSNFFLFM